MKANYISPSCEKLDVITSTSICQATTLTPPDTPFGPPASPARKLYV